MNVSDERRYEPRTTTLLGVAIIALAATLACLPIMLHRGSCGDDLQFHLLSWFDAQQSWRLGSAYPHWSPSANYGAGEPRFIFYPPLTWMAGAALGSVLPWNWVPVALLFLLLSGTGLAARMLARRFLPSMPATLAAVAAVLCVYPLFTAYARAAFGELAGGIWIPLLLYFALEDRTRSARPWQRALDGSTLPLALVVALCWLSDAPVGVMGCYLLMAVALGYAMLARCWFPLVRAVIAVTLGLGLAGLYVVPAAWEQRWVNIQEAMGVGDPGLKIENNWLFGHTTHPPMPEHDAGLHFVSCLAVAMLAVTFAAMAAVWLRRSSMTLPQRRRWILLACLPVVVLLLQLPLSWPVWFLLPKLRYLQFPWRWLLVLEAPMGIWLAAAVWPRAETPRWRRVVIAVIFCTLPVACLLYANATCFMQTCHEDEKPANLGAHLRAGAGSWGADEYAPSGAEDILVPTGLPDVCLAKAADADLGVDGTPTDNPGWNPASCIAIATAMVRTPEHLRVMLNNARSGVIILRLRAYPAWRIHLNGVAISALPMRKDGLIAVPISAGQVDLTVDWITTPDVIVGRVLTGLSVLALMVLWWIERKRPHS
jgi:hypothetical protein